MFDFVFSLLLNFLATLTQHKHFSILTNCYTSRVCILRVLTLVVHISMVDLLNVWRFKPRRNNLVLMIFHTRYFYNIELINKWKILTRNQICNNILILDSFIEAKNCTNTICFKLYVLKSILFTSWGKVVQI